MDDNDSSSRKPPKRQRGVPTEVGHTRTGFSKSIITMEQLQERDEYSSQRVSVQPISKGPGQRPDPGAPPQSEDESQPSRARVQKFTEVFPDTEKRKILSFIVGSPTTPSNKEEPFTSQSKEPQEPTESLQPGSQTQPTSGTYEMKLPRGSNRRSERHSLESAGPAAGPAGGGTVRNVHINPRTLGSLVAVLKSLYGGKMNPKMNKKKRKKKSGGSDEPGEIEERIALTEEGAELLTKKLYGDITDSVNDFLELRRDCERELEFQEATFPRWVRYLWKVHLLYEFVTSCVLLFSVFYGTYSATFGTHSTDKFLHSRVDVLIFIDVIVRLLIEIWRSVTKCQYEVFTVNYTFSLALLDLVALIPVSQIFFMYADMSSLSNVSRISLLELKRVAQIFRMAKILDKLQEDMNLGHLHLFLFLLRYVIHYCLIVHLLACLFFTLGGKSYMDWLLNRSPEYEDERQYVTFLSIRSHLAIPPDKYYQPYPTSFGLYTLSLYISVATVSTVGFGDFFPVNDIERFVIIIMMMVGAIWISGELAYKLGTFFTDLDASRYMMFFRLSCIKIHLRNYHLSDFVCRMTELYYKHLWRYRKGVHEIDLTYLPHCVQQEIKFDLCEEMFFKSPMFRGLDETFLMGLAKSAKVSLFQPKMILFERGAITKQMCFILQGEVAVAAGLNDDYISAIHRAGCLIGEINLFMAIPYEQTMYTKTVCTIMTITKKDLMLSLQDNPHIFAVLRDRMRKRRERFRDAFELDTTHPYMRWLKVKDMDKIRCDPEFPVLVNNMHGWNKPVTGYPMENEDEQVIIEMPCIRDDLKRGEVHAYRLVSVPQIYYNSGFVLTLYNIGTMSLWLYLVWFTPGCSTYDEFENTYFTMCQAISQYWYFVVFVCIVDFIVELVFACPSTGMYYKLKDGLEVSKTSIGFYCDLISCFPTELLFPRWFSSLFRMLLKFWKIGRMWDFLDEKYALKLFYVRIAKMTYYLLYLSFLIALFFLNLVCIPGRGHPCNEVSFFNPVYPTNRWERVREGTHFEQYILFTPVVYAVSLITSVGFGNIFPQTTKEMLWSMFFMIIGHFFVSYILAQLTSALAARLTPKLLFHQKLLVVETFVRHNGLSTRLLQKLVEHYDLQHQYVSGCSLPQGTHLMYDGHKVLLEDVFLVEGEIFFDGVPAFAKIPSQAIIDISRLMRRFVVPPDLIFVQRGEVRRELYVIVSGSVALYQHGEKSASAVLTSTGHFGLRDLLFGEPYPYKVKTLSYVILYAVDYAVFQEVLGDDEGLIEYINDEMLRREHEIKQYIDLKIVDEDGPSVREIVPPSWIRYPNHPDVPALGSDLTYDHFEKGFVYYAKSEFIRDMTMPDVVHPAGAFATIWQGLMGFAAIANLLFLIIETFMGYRGPVFRVLQWLLDLLFCVDIFIKCHFAFYDYNAGQLKYHPLATWMRYVFHGSFFIEVAMMIPLELILAFSGSTDLFGYGRAHSWYTKLRWIRFLRCFKFAELYTIVHRIFENRTTVMFIFYLSITVLMSTILGALAWFFACPTFGYDWKDGDQFKMPVCHSSTWVFYKTNEQKALKDVYKPQGAPTLPPAYLDELFYPGALVERWVYGLYYVGQVLMVIGFGDQASFRSLELEFVTSVALFGFIVSQAIISDITSAQIDTDEIRSQNRESLDRLAIALSREGAPKYFTKYVRAAFRVSWSYARGLQPNDLFGDLHPILHRELLREYIGDVLDRVPIFLGFPDAFVNSLRQKFRIEFFPKGGLVTRAGDLDYCMYIVVRGSLWVCDRNDRWLCTLTTGDSVGEMSLVYSAKRRFSAYAATNVQLLVLNAIDFASVLELSPLTRKQILKGLIDYKRDSYLVKAWKWKAKDPEGYAEAQEVNTSLLKSFSLQNMCLINVRGHLNEEEQKKYIKEPGFWGKIIGHGCSETVSQYLYFASDDERFNFIIHPACGFNVHFQVLIQIIRFLSPMIALFHIFFYIDDSLDVTVLQVTTWFARIFDLLLYINILLKFFTAVELAERKTYCKNFKKICVHYLFRPTGFLFDIMVCFPYQYVTQNQGTRFLLFRCFLSIRFFSNLWKLQDNIEVSSLMFKLSTSFSFLIYLSHVLACVFFWISCKGASSGTAPKFDLGKCKPNGWVYKFRLNFGKLYGQEGANSAVNPPILESDISKLYTSGQPSHWYFTSLYWVMTVLTTVGFGDITPSNFEEISLAVFCIFFGSLFLSIMLGNITSGLSSHHKFRRQFLGKVEKMLDYLKVIGLSTVGHQTLGAYCNTTWNNCRGVNYNDIADILPLYVQKDVYLALYHKCITGCLFFGRDYDLSFVRAVCCRVRHFMFLPGMRIANELEPGTGIYIVMRGAVTSFQQNPVTGNYEFIKRYEENAVFGRIPALYPGALYNKSYRAEDKTEVLLMYHADMRQLLMKYPKWKLLLQEIIAREYSFFSTKTSLKNITERRLNRHERLSKSLTEDQLREAANMFTSDPQDRKGKVTKEASRTHRRPSRTSIGSSTRVSFRKEQSSKKSKLGTGELKKESNDQSEDIAENLPNTPSMAWEGGKMVAIPGRKHGIQKASIKKVGGVITHDKERKTYVDLTNH